MAIKTVLIDSYLSTLSREQRKKLLEVMEYILSVTENAVVSSVFTLPGFTVEFLPICNLRVKGRKIMLRFFQKDVFAVFAERLSAFELGRCSITVRSAEELQCDAIKELLRLTAVSAKVDAAFTRSVQMRDYGYYNSQILTPRAHSEENI